MNFIAWITNMLLPHLSDLKGTRWVFNSLFLNYSITFLSPIMNVFLFLSRDFICQQKVLHTVSSTKHPYNASLL